MEIFIVIASTGEYLEREEPIISYDTKEAAIKHVAEATKWANTWINQYKDKRSDDIWPKGSNPWDKVSSYIDYTGISYFYKTVQFKQKIN